MVLWLLSLAPVTQINNGFCTILVETMSMFGKTPLLRNASSSLALEIHS